MNTNVLELPMYSAASNRKQEFTLRRSPRPGLWRDRKGVVGNLLTPMLNLLFVYGAVTWGESELTGHPWVVGAQHPALQWLFSATFVLSGFQMGVRALCSRRIYGWRFAMGVPVRAMVGNWLN